MQNRRSQVLLLFACAILLTGVGFAGNCPVTTLDAYLGSGYSCGIDDKTFFSFSYSSSSNPGGYAIPANGVAVNPITTPGNPGFQFSAPWAVSNNSNILAQDSLIGYTVTVNQGGAPITDLTLAIGGFGAIGTGEVTVDETYCLGAVLPTCTGGIEGTLKVYWTANGGTTSQTVNFAGVSEVSVLKDIDLQSGTGGEASLSAVYNQFSEGQPTPEPGTLGMIGLGVISVAAFTRRKLNL